MKKIAYYISACLLFAFSACSDWLDVNPKTHVKEEELFSTEQGFKEALTGIYMNLCSTNLYGRELTYGFLDILAQRYNTGYTDQESIDYTRSAWYEFPSTLTETKTNAFWSEMYNTIANINNFLGNLESRGHEVITTDGYYNLMKGEMLGLRSYIYFDLLRMFGPIYKDNPDSPSLPYRTRFSRDNARLLPASAIVDSLIVTLKEAEQLLADAPMNISFPTSLTDEDDNIDPFLNYRFNRMNLCAVKAELARVLLYKGDAQSKAEAARYAQEVIDYRKGSSLLFQLVTDNSTDRMCSTELIFALSMDSENFDTQIENDFQITMSSAYYIRERDRVYELFDTGVDGYNDMRMREGQGFTISNNGSRTLKYDQTGLFSPAIENIVPLVRLPEMYYIVAECTDDLMESAGVLSNVRSARGLSTISTFRDAADKLTAIEKEYRKEFYAEGQLWYFYKRQGYETFQFCPINPMTESRYRFSIPDDESSLGAL